MRLRSRILFSMMIVLLLQITACDSGDIYPEEDDETNDVTVTGSFHFLNSGAFPLTYTIILGAFTSESDEEPSSYAIISNPEDDTTSVQLSGIADDTGYIKLCLYNSSGNNIVYDFYSYTIDETPSAGIALPHKEIDLAVYGRLQEQLFAQCILCHGGSNSAAAELDLTEGNSYSNLVNHQAVNSDKYRVSPYDLDNSFLYEVLTEETTLTYTHSDISTLEDDDISLLETWIGSGAEE